MARFDSRGVMVLVVALLALGILAGCAPAPEPVAPPEPEPAVEAPDDPRARPSIDEAEAAVLALARAEYPTMPIESADVHAMGQDAEGTWWVQAWTTASPGFEGEQGEQWFVTWDGESWELVSYGTGLGTDEFPQVEVWEEQP